MKKVLLALPTGGSFHWKLVEKIVDISKDKRYNVDVFVSRAVGTEANQNTIAQRFLEGCYDYLLLIEIDQVPLSNPLDMVEYNKDVISMPTLLKIKRMDGRPVWSVFDRDSGGTEYIEPRLERGKGIEEVHAVSMGCVLIKNSVLEKIEFPFTPLRDAADNILTTSDILFCERARKNGFKIWVDWDNCTSHFKEVDLLEI